jgi:hypothetical protein
MTPRKLAVLTVAAYLTFAGTPTAGAQIGGLIKKKVGETVKGPDKTKEKAKEPGGAEVGSKVGFVLDEDVFQAFQAGLQTEIHERDAFRKRLASVKTPAQYEACKTNALTNTPDGRKFSEDYMEAMGKLGDNAAGKKPEQIMKEQQEMAEKFTKRSDALMLKSCGEDPTPVINSQVQVFERAAHAGAMEFGKVFNRRPSGGDEEPAPDSLSEQPCMDSPPLTAGENSDIGVESCGGSRPLALLAGATLVRADSTSDEEKERRYGFLKEWVGPFCVLTKQQQEDAVAVGIKIPGTGPAIYWVYAKSEAKLLFDHCDTLMKLLKLLAV